MYDECESIADLIRGKSKEQGGRREGCVVCDECDCHTCHDNYDCLVCHSHVMISMTV